MIPRLVSRSPFSVAGPQIRTCNRDEGTPSTARIPALWGQFHGQALPDNLAGRKPGSPVYGVYHDYESDETGFYSVLAGLAVLESIGSGYAHVDIQEGEYLVFENKGPMPQAVIDTWKAIWAFFEDNTTYTRRFSTDFEEYLGPNEIAVHIAVSRRQA